VKIKITRKLDTYIYSSFSEGWLYTRNHYEELGLHDPYQNWPPTNQNYLDLIGNRRWIAYRKKMTREESIRYMMEKEEEQQASVSETERYIQAGTGTFL
jgi:hypothetical protein